MIRKFFKFKKLNIVILLVSICITCLYILGYITSRFFIINEKIESKTFVIIFAIILCIITYSIVKRIYSKFDNLKIEKTKDSKFCSKFFTGNIKSIIFVMLIIFVAYFPYLLDSFPGYVSYDFAIQIRQALNYEPIVNHHPYLHTKLIGLFFKLGSLVSGNKNVGLFLYTLTQCVLTCFTFSFIIYYMAKKSVDYKYRVFTLCVFICIPIFGFYSVWLTKDIMFSLCMTFVTIYVIEMITNKDCIKSYKFFIFVIIISFLTMAFRKNGIYVIAILGIVMTIVNHKNWFRTMSVFLIPIIFFCIFDGPVRNYKGIENGSDLEMFSIPAQQMARIYKYETNLTEKDKQTIEEYIIDDNIDLIYDPVLSDPVKAKLNGEKINNDKTGFLKFVLKLALKYPKETIKSFVATTYRFFYVENEIQRGVSDYKSQSKYVIEYLLPDDLKINRNTVNINFVNSINDLIASKKIGVLDILTGSGIYISICIVSIGYAIYRKKFITICSYLPAFLVLATQLAGPVVDQRYVYIFFTCTGLLIGITMFASDKTENGDKDKV